MCVFWFGDGGCFRESISECVCVKVLVSAYEIRQQQAGTFSKKHLHCSCETGETIYTSFFEAFATG